MLSITSARQLPVQVVTAVGVIAASAAGGAAHAQTKIVEGIVSHGALQWPEYAAIEFGWFKENGVDLDMVIAGGGAAQQLAAEALNIGYRGTRITRHPHVVGAVSAAVGEDVEERLRPAHREARKLDERAIPERVEGRAAAGVIRRGVLRAEADVGAQRSRSILTPSFGAAAKRGV